MTPESFSDESSYYGIEKYNESYYTSVQKCKETYFEDEVNQHINNELMNVAVCLNSLSADSGQKHNSSHSSEAGEDMMVEVKENGFAGNANHLLYNGSVHDTATTTNDHIFNVAAVDTYHQISSLSDDERCNAKSCINNQQNGDRSNFLCKFFLNRRCKFGDACKFLHDESVFCPTEQKIFLGGLPRHCTQEVLTTILEKKGLTVLNKPKIKGSGSRFSPQVCLDSAADAKKLIELGGF